jgi:hypothetical protein
MVYGRLEAIRALFHRPDVAGKWVTMPPMFDATGQPIEETIRFGEEALANVLNKKILGQVQSL